LLVPNATFCGEKLKFSCVVVTSKLPDAVAPEIVTMTPFSYTSAAIPGGVSPTPMAIFQVDVPGAATESVPVNRQSFRRTMVAPVAVMEPSQMVFALSPTARITRNDCVAGEGIGADCSETQGCHSNLIHARREEHERG
jgi:hypothetical protein